MSTKTTTTTTEASAEDRRHVQGVDTTTYAAADRRQALWIGNNNGVLIVLDVGLLTVTLFFLCLLAVLF